MTVKLQAGDAAPDFSLPSSTGEELSLEGFRARKLLFSFIQRMIHRAVLRKHVAFVMPSRILETRM